MQYVLLIYQGTTPRAETLSEEEYKAIGMSDASSITDTLTHPTITKQTSPHFAEALGRR